MNFLNRFFKNKKESKTEIKISDEVHIPLHISKSVNINRENLEKAFENCDDLTYRTVKLQDHEKTIEVLLIYLNNLVDLKDINQNIIKPLNSYDASNNVQSRDEKININTIEEIINTHDIQRINNMKYAMEGILSGDTLLLMDHDVDGLLLRTQGGEIRSIEESDVESVIRGPRDSFIENVHVNIGLIRKKIKSPSLKVKQLIIGSESHTIVCVCYMENIVNQQALSNIMNKLKEIKIDGIFESGYIEQYLEGSPYSPFPQMQITERPDKVCGNLLEGKIIILVDGSPVSLILPISFFQLFQSPEDYYERVLFGNFTRLLRFLGFFIATSLPSIYVALISFHQEMLPMDLIIDLSRSRAQVPFPPVIEAILMEVTIELLRESSARLPGTIGQTIGIVGAIVIGDAAIQANIVSPVMIIVVAVTALGSYVLPHYSSTYPLRMIRFPIILMAATFGAFGIIIAWTWIIIHLCSIDSFGYPYLSPLAPLDPNIKKDALIRGTLWGFRKRPQTANKGNRSRW
ncbi:GerA spore germination protein [Alkaliphilus metalliredigens QYMF]|uniref:GerA spore germination protein n=1 Tax=Alkaliphilus metalliredigens (strain QYMF) TaxID=293826 RepID=A6TKM3_ALKMQ|nr:spore germination protein [Alkaliphilus metalliredigens]ABR46741.1 GerA spore germination protein [Alkaliphilus metalliredigens QYMF]